jgi:hypothetical protein
MPPLWGYTARQSPKGAKTPSRVRERTEIKTHTAIKMYGNKNAWQ